MKKLISLIALLVLSVSLGIGQDNKLVLGAPSPSGPQQIFITQSGATGQTYYCYWVVAVFTIGMGAPSPAGCTSNSNATLSGSNYNTITWTGVPGGSATGFWVIRNTSNSFPATGTTAVNSSVITSSTFTYNDQSNTLNAFTYSPAPYATMQLYVDNTNNNEPVLKGVSVEHNDFPVVAVSPPTTAGSGGFWRVPYARYTVSGSIPIATVNSGAVILPASATRQYRIVGFQLQAIGGNVGGCTSVNISDTTGTPVVSVAVPVADLTQNTIVTPTASSLTFTTYAWQGLLTLGKGVQIIKSGSDCTTATSVNYEVSWAFN